MRLPSQTERSRSGRQLKITPVKSDERRRRVRNAIAKRAFQICESRGSKLGHQLEDWRSAESEILRPLNCGYLMLDDKIELNTDAACYEPGEIEICVEPQRLTICGNERVCKPSEKQVKGDSPLNGNPIFRSLDLPFEIEPSQVKARFKGRTIEIDLPKAHAMQKAATEKNAA